MSDMLFGIAAGLVVLAVMAGIRIAFVAWVTYHSIRQNRETP